MLQRSIDEKQYGGVVVHLPGVRLGQGQADKDNQQATQPDGEPAAQRPKPGQAAVAEPDHHRHE